MIEPLDNVSIIAPADDFNRQVNLIANHPTVLLHLMTFAARYHFSYYYCVKQNNSTELLSLLDTIERYRCVPIAELVAEMKELYGV